jgi:serine/threonine protein kinase
VVQAKLGAGGMGVVYLAWDPELARNIAIKMLTASVSEARLVREARALARLAHPNVVTVYDVGTFGGRTFVAMELLDGITVKAWLQAQPRSWREALEVFLLAGRGLAAAHTAGLIHRDFKPENVIITRDGRVRVLDFGLANAPSTKDISSDREFPAQMDNVELTASGTLMGTPAYMSPEQLRMQETDARTDQFSFCVSLWEALYGVRPFGGRTLQELARSMTAAVLPKAPRDSPVPAWLRRIVARGLSVDRDARYPTMDALLAAVNAGLAEEQLSARMIGRRYTLIQPTAESDVAKGDLAVDRLTGKVVTVMSVRDGAAMDRAETRLALTHTFQRLSALRHPNLAGLLDFGFNRERRPYFILDLNDHTEDLLSVGRLLPVSLQIDYLLQCLRALVYLHRRRMVLGTLPPGSVRVAGGQVRLVPLGFERALGLVSPAYTAPEVLRGEVPSPAADLYTLGILAFELLSGRHPFGGAPRGAEPPNLLALEVEPKIATIIGHLLEPEPTQRLESAEVVIAMMAEASGRAFTIDTAEIRESYLQTASLVGRGAEWSRLEGALAEALAGRGSAWLLGGESGVGKSRLLNEVRTRALSQSALVLRGQEESEGGGPYRVFRDVLRWLALLSDLDDTEASTLLPIVPDLPRLLGRPIPPAPEGDPVSIHARVCDVVERMLQRQDQPLVILLEDLQWSGSDSIKLLQSIVPITRELPLLLLATHRNDERPSLGKELPGMQALMLARLTDQAITDFAVAIAGEAGHRPELVGLLQRETEGNAFFLVEVLRELTEEAGGIDRLGTAVLPERVFAGGIRRVVQRRLQRVPEEAQALLRIAAVIGRKIDLLLLQALAPSTDLDAWVGRCLEVFVLERLGDEYRFAHDKLREGILRDMENAQKAALHGQVAKAIERVYPDTTTHLTALAYHYGAAGDLTNEARYAALAGVQAVRTGAAHEGVRLLERALALPPLKGMTAIQLANFNWELGIAKTYIQSHGEARVHFSTALRVLRCPAPGGILSLLSQMLVHVAAWLAPRLIEVRSEQRKEELRLAARVVSEMSGGYMQENNQIGLVGACFLSANLAMRAGEVNPLSLSYLGMMFSTVGLSKLANAYFFRMSGTGGQTLNRRELSQALLVRSTYLLGIGNLEELPAVLEQIRALSTRNDSVAHGYCDTFDGLGAYLLGDLASALRYSRRALSHPGLTHSSHELVYVSQTATVLCWMGLVDEALTQMERCRPQLGVHDPGPTGFWHGAMARIHVLRKDTGTALEHADKGVSMIKSPAVLPMHGMLLIESALLAHVTAWRGAQVQGADVQEISRRTRKFLRFARTWAKVHPAGVPLFLMGQGHVEWLEGRRDAARETWHQAVESARQFSFRLLEAQAHQELARAAEAGSLERREHVEAARQQFMKSGVTSYGLEIDALDAAPVVTPRGAGC